MATHVYNKKREKYKRVSEYDTSLMLTLKDVLPNDSKIAKEFLVKKEDAPVEILRDIYHTKDNSGLVRKVFVTFLKSILFEIAMGRCQFYVPLKGKTTPKIYMGRLHDKVVKNKRSIGRIPDLDLMAMDYNVPYIRYKLSDNTSKRDLSVYVNKKIWKEIVDYANSGQTFSKLPRTIEYFLPVIFEEFSYIEEQGLEKLIKHCFSRLHWHLRRGEEVRILDQDGEIRFFRPLGKAHDKIMTTVVKQRLTRERNKRYATFN